MKQIQWFPGHMAKGLKDIKESIKSIDLVIELLDSRIPFSSSNPELNKIISNKQTLIVLTKKDLANDAVTETWVNYYKKLGYCVIATDINKIDYNLIKSKASEVLKEKIEKDKAKGLRLRPIKAMIIGIPNVGKSTLINKLSKRKATKVENRPGVTTNKQYIKIDNDFILLDTPGVLWPSFDNETIGINLSLVGSIKQSILPNEYLVYKLFEILTHKYAGLLSSCYSINEIVVDSEEDSYSNLELIGKSRGFILSNNSIDFERTIIHVLREFSNGKMGKISLEEVNNG